MEDLRNIAEICFPIVEQVCNYRSIDEKLQALKRKLEDLSSREADVITELEIAEIQPQKRRKNEVRNWLRNVEKKKNEVERIEQDMGERRCFTHLQLGKRLDKLSADLTELIEQGRFPEGLLLDGLETRGNLLLTPKLINQAFLRKLDEIWSYLMEDEFLKIGIYGLGGVGKTVLVMHIHNQILQYSNVFSSVYWITVSQDFSVRKLQNDIARALDLDLPSEDEGKRRAATLSKALTKRKRSVLILDDVWNHLSLEEVGIPIGANGCKVILTTRSLDLCRGVGCQKDIKVEPLPEEGAWEFFKEKLGHAARLAPETKEIARLVAKECAGLPLALNIKARSMRGVDDISEWRNALGELRDPERVQDEMELEVFKILESSYSWLKDPKVQQCFLFCTLFPEDYRAERGELIQYFISEGLINGMKSRQAEFDRGHSILNKLENCCLLENVTDLQSGRRWVKMNGMIRKMALRITKASPLFMSKAGAQLTEIPDEQEWKEGVEKASLMGNDVLEIPAGKSPVCPKLTTLLLRDNCLNKIADSFFLHLCLLQILDLSFTFIEELPSSVADLRTLTTLLLRNCCKLRSMPSLTNLSELRKLDVAYTRIREVPHGLDMLVHLKHLNLYAEHIQMLPIGLLPKLSCLQYLAINWWSENLKVRGEEVAGLRKLETFAACFPDLHEFNKYVESLQGRLLSNYFLRVGPMEAFRVLADEGDYINKDISFRKCSMADREAPLVLPDDTQKLDIIECHDMKSLSDISSLNRMTSLRHCQIVSCDGMECLVSSSADSFCPPTQSLESLYLSDLHNFRFLFSQEKITSSEGAATCHFARLRKFSIKSCPNIKKVFTFQLLLSLHSLEEIHVENCEAMQVIIAASDETLKEEVGGRGASSSVQSMVINSDPGRRTTLPKLKHLSLIDLPELRFICAGKLGCDLLLKPKVRNCPKFKASDSLFFQ